MPVFSRGVPILYPLLLLHLVFSLLAAQEEICAQNCCDSVNSFLFLQYDLRDSCEEILPCASSQIRFCLALLFNTTGLPVLLTLSLARHCGCGSRDLSDSWTGFTQFTLLQENLQTDLCGPG